MIKRTLFGALAGIVTLSPACGSNEPHEQTTPICVGPPSNDPSCVLPVDERSFVRTALPVTDGVSTARVSHTAGKFCMSGQIDPGPANMNWGAALVLHVTDPTPGGIVAPFSAPARGVAKVQFTIDQPPIAGLTVAIGAVKRADCLEVPTCFTDAPFYFVDAGHAEEIIEDAGTVTAALTSFVQPSWGDPSLSFDPSLISHLQFSPQLLPGVVLSYDFCVRDVKFLDAGGREVSP